MIQEFYLNFSHIVLKELVMYAHRDVYLLKKSNVGFEANYPSENQSAYS
ncbi:hypothetical protein Fsol_00220 [Candidatus Fokinia solitaria]|uniref:Uncharacterized protein n=1 Tax=Candidatus Fokinia solitaria TaxID=1802984 RepID=A0A2U8BRP9_9RICK|nr:hypothetical protein Fsol_00220 [Candidatus Fokinia solitaria]